MKKAKRKQFESGVALLIVLFVVMAITIISLGFLSRADRQLACGSNMVLRMQIHYLANSGLTHAKAFVAATKPANQEFILAQIDGTDDHYDVVINPVLDPNSLPTGDYDITCQAYRMTGLDKLAQCTMTAKLYSDPTGNSTYYKFINGQ